MKFNFIYLAGSIIAFVGLLWMFIPHIYHSGIIGETIGIAETGHIWHIFQGLVVFLIGVFVMIYKAKES